MSKIEIEVPNDMPKDVARFAAENELRRRQKRKENIREAIERLNLSEQDIELFERAREEVWKKRKEELY